MAYHHIPHQQIRASWRTFYSCGKWNSSLSKRLFYTLRALGQPSRSRTYSSSITYKNDFCKGCHSLNSGFCNVVRPISSSVISTSAQIAEEINQSTLSDSAVCEDGPTTTTPSNGRVMLIDGTSIIYRAYYKLLAKLHHGHLSHADGNGDWVLTIFSALSLYFLEWTVLKKGKIGVILHFFDYFAWFCIHAIIIDVLEFLPSHIAVVFDHDDRTIIQFAKQVYLDRILVVGGLKVAYGVMAEDHMVMLLFHPNKVLLRKLNRPPTPDTVVQGLQYLKASIKAMSIKVIEVPGVEADDVIGTLAVRSVSGGFKVRVVSPDKDFFQILSPSLRLLRIAPRGFEMSSFGMEDFARKYGTLKPSQFVDVISLVGDKSDNIPGVDGIGDVNAVQLITKFGD
ncbi:hypothetical protein OROGR_016241 [Orobanche gracilis]